jgi:dihydroorotate dehydrogenase
MSDIADTYAEFEPRQSCRKYDHISPSMLSFFSKVVGRVPPEFAQQITVRFWAFASNTRPLPFFQPNNASLFFSKRTDDERLRISVLGRSFPNPIGQAAGLDKNARIMDGVVDVGFGFGEVGTVTPRHQKGNERPRLFRLRKDKAVINRMGFNNVGVEKISRRLHKRRRHRGIIGANIGANKDSKDRVSDYVECFRCLNKLVDYITINVSSPNTPGLRGLQNRSELENLLSNLTAARSREQSTVPLLLKIAPDLDDDAIHEIASVALASKIEGLIVSNTTTQRAHLKSTNAFQEGGLSGRPLFEQSTKVLKQVRKLVGDRVVLVGVGGISSGQDAYAKIRAGASLVQLYTALIYEGPSLIDRIKVELIELLVKDGFTSIADAVGIDAQ